MLLRLCLFVVALKKLVASGHSLVLTNLGDSKDRLQNFTFELSHTLTAAMGTYTDCTSAAHGLLSLKDRQFFIPTIVADYLKVKKFDLSDLTATTNLLQNELRGHTMKVKQIENFLLLNKCYLTFWEAYKQKVVTGMKALGQELKTLQKDNIEKFLIGDIKHPKRIFEDNIKELSILVNKHFKTSKNAKSNKPIIRPPSLEMIHGRNNSIENEYNGFLDIENPYETIPFEHYNKSQHDEKTHDANRWFYENGSEIEQDDTYLIPVN